ncbi:hypothetical protein Tco_0921549, partial [Tanacetum coccineum]
SLEGRQMSLAKILSIERILSVFPTHFGVTASACESAKALYSTFIEDLETTNYFLDDQDMRQEPRKIAKPETNLHVIGHTA